MCVYIYIYIYVCIDTMCKAIVKHNCNNRVRVWVTDTSTITSCVIRRHFGSSPDL